MTPRPFIGALVLAMACMADARASVVEKWNHTFLQAVRKETPPPCLVSRNLPIFHLAIHRAVQGAVNAGLDEAQQEQVAHHAARSVFLTFFPSQQQMAEQMDEMALTGRISSIGQEIVAAAVQRTFKERENDGSSTTVHYVPSDIPGQWRRTPPTFRPPEFPHWGKVRPFVVKDVTQFRAIPPPALNSAEYAEELNLLKEVGGKISSKRTREQTLIAHFWADFSYTSSPPGHWNEIAREVSLKRGLTVAEVARIFAVLNLALADTCITIWDTKYHYKFWRPVTAIRRADEDDNDATEADKTWDPLLPSPPHPEYVSGHSGISGAAATVMEHFFGTKDISFEASSDDVKDVTRLFTSFQMCAEEIAQSRVYGGIHYAVSGREGLRMGKCVAEEVLRNFKE